MWLAPSLYKFVYFLFFFFMGGLCFNFVYIAIFFIPMKYLKREKKNRRRENAFIEKRRREKVQTLSRCLYLLSFGCSATRLWCRWSGTRLGGIPLQWVQSLVVVARELDEGQMPQMVDLGHGARDQNSGFRLLRMATYEMVILGPWLPFWFSAQTNSMAKTWYLFSITQGIMT